MKILTLLRALAIAATPAMALAPTAGFGANADAPYRNVDHTTTRATTPVTRGSRG